MFSSGQGEILYSSFFTWAAIMSTETRRSSLLCQALSIKLPTVDRIVHAGIGRSRQHRGAGGRGGPLAGPASTGGRSEPSLRILCSFSCSASKSCSQQLPPARRLGVVTSIVKTCSKQKAPQRSPFWPRWQLCCSKCKRLIGYLDHVRLLERPEGAALRTIVQFRTRIHRRRRMLGGLFARTLRPMHVVCQAERAV